MLEGNWRFQARASPNLVSFQSVHPPNVSTVVFALKHAVLMPSRKLHFFRPEGTHFVEIEQGSSPTQETKRILRSSMMGYKQQQVVMYELRCFGEGCKEGSSSPLVCYTKRHPNTHTKVPHRLQHCTTPSGGHFLQLRIQMNSRHSKACECYFALIPRSTPQEKPQSDKCLPKCAWLQFSTCGNINRLTRC